MSDKARDPVELGEVRKGIALNPTASLPTDPSLAPPSPALVHPLQPEIVALREQVGVLRWLHAEAAWWMNRWEPSFHGNAI